jgi:hypothetical protein
MKPTDDTQKLIKKLHLKASPKLDMRVHNDISEALAESKPSAAGPIVWRLAVAAAIIIAFGIGFVVGQMSKPAQLTAYSLNTAGNTIAVSTATSFWQQKVNAVMQPRPYLQNQFNKINLIDAYKQYLKGETL